MSRAYRDDEIYFHKGGQPCSGKVLSSGKHGCTVEHKGEQHKVKWENVSGFKKRSKQDYRLIEDGEDGVIVENQHGHRQYLGIPPEARAEQLELAEQKKSKSPDKT